MRWYRWFAGWVGDRPWFRPIATTVLPTVDKLLLHLRGWYSTPFPTLLLTTTGLKTGDLHEAPLYYLDDDGFVVIATNYGRREPDWSRNLRAEAQCTLLVGRATIPALAREADEGDWDRYLEEFAAFFPPYLDYVARAGHRIPIWKLTPTRA